MANNIRAVMHAVFRAPSYVLLSPLLLASRWSGEIRKFTASVSSNLVAGWASWLIGGALAWFVSSAGTPPTVIAPPAENSFWREPWPKPCAGERWCVLVAGLDRDSDGAQTRNVAESLAEVLRADSPGTPVQVLLIPRQLKAPPAGDIGAGDAKVKATGRAWLKRLGGDLLIYGSVIANDKVMRLSFLSANFGTGARYALDSASYALPLKFNADMGSALAAMAAANIVPDRDTGRFVVSILKPIAARIRPLYQNPLEGMTGADRGAIAFAYASVSGTIGDQTSNVQSWNDAAEAYRAAAKAYGRDTAPVDWAKAQRGLGNVVSTLGQYQNDTALLDESIEAYRQSLTVETRETTPLDWASSSDNLGSALTVLGYHSKNRSLIEQGIAAHRDALTVYSLERQPLDWAATQNNLAGGLDQLDDVNGNGAHSAEIVSAFRDALTVYTHEKYPLDWAMAQNNLCVILEEQGLANRDERALIAARKACGDALSEYPRSRNPMNWAMAQYNLANVLRDLGQLDNDRPLVEQAIAIYGAALQEWTEKSAPFNRDELNRDLAKARIVLTGLKPKRSTR